MKDYLEGSVRTYIKELSGKTIVPGGGSASALTAAIGTGLNLMVLNYSIKEDAGQDLMWQKERQEESLERLSLFVDEDAKAFSALMEAVSSGTADEGHYVGAAKVPMEVCKECNISMEVTKHLADNGNMNLVTDIGCAAHILKAAFSSARLNVEVNLKYIKDSSFCRKTREELDSLQKNIAEMEDYIKNKFEEMVG